MVRDVVNTRKYYRSTDTETDNLNGGQTVSKGPFSIEVSRFAFRDDAVSTVRENQGYVHPTRYGTCRYGMDTGVNSRKEHEIWGVFNPCYHVLGVDRTYESIGLAPEGVIGMFGTVSSVYEAPPGSYYGIYKRIPDIPGFLESRALRALQDNVHQKSWALAQSMGELPETVRMLIVASRRLLMAVRLAKAGLEYRHLLSRDGYAWSKRLDSIVDSHLRPSRHKYLYSIDIRQHDRIMRKAMRGLSYESTLVSRSAAQIRRAGSTMMRQKRSTLRNIAQYQLEYQYGWLPLMSDIQQLASAVEYGLTQPISAYETVTKESTFDFSEQSEDRQFETYDVSGSGRYVVKVGIKAYVSNDTLVQIGSHGLLNPAALAWELFPLSFVIDWFMPVGSFLSGLTSHFGMDFRDGYMTKYVEWKRSSSTNIKPTTLTCVNTPERKFHETAGSRGVRYYVEMQSSEWLECMYRDHMITLIPPVPYWDPDLGRDKIRSLLTLAAAMVK